MDPYRRYFPTREVPRDPITKFTALSGWNRLWTLRCYGLGQVFSQPLYSYSFHSNLEIFEPNMGSKVDRYGISPTYKSYISSIAVLEAANLEQLPRIPPTNLLLSLLRQINRIIPRTSILKRLERIINTEKNPRSPNLFDAILQRGSRKVATGSDPDVLRKVLSDRLLTRLLQAERFLDVLEPVVDPPEVEGNVLAQVADDDLELGEAVEEAVGHHSEEVQTDALGETEGRTDQPFAVCPQLIVYASGRVPWVQVEGDIEFLDSGPEDVPVCAVVEDHVFAFGAGSLSVVDERAQEPKLGDASSAASLGSCMDRVLNDSVLARVSAIIQWQYRRTQTLQSDQGNP
jgi:hypothetical protein